MYSCVREFLTSFSKYSGCILSTPTWFGKFSFRSQPWDLLLEMVVFCGFTWSLQVDARIIPEIRTALFSFHLCFSSLLINYPAIEQCIVSANKIIARTRIESLTNCRLINLLLLNAKCLQIWDCIKRSISCKGALSCSGLCEFSGMTIVPMQRNCTEILQIIAIVHGNFLHYV
jgi:hypothetical protein